MKRFLTLLTLVGALVAVAVPASATANPVVISPAGHGFSITNASPAGGMPRFSGSLEGSCTMTKANGTIPAAPGNESATGSLTFPITTPTFSCVGGMTGTFSGTWKLGVGSTYAAGVIAPAKGVTLRYASLPGCRIDNGAEIGALGYWSNGVSTPVFSHSGVIFPLLSEVAFTYANDGAGSCALAGKTEKIKFISPGGVDSAVTDTTVGTTNITVAGGL
jgi:hypothetical protein